MHKIKQKINFFDTWKKNYEFFRGYHSNFNFECNTERGSLGSLSIALGKRPIYSKDLTKLAILYKYKHHYMVCILSKSTKTWFVIWLQTVTHSTLMTLLLVHCRSKADFLFFYNIQIQKMGNNSITTTLLPYFFCV